jgi:hypothetical protein
MPQTPPPSPETIAIAKRIEEFEASASIANTGTGSRREGAGFELLVRQFWESVRAQMVLGGAGCEYVRGVGTRHYACLTLENRSIHLPAPMAVGLTDPSALPRRWLEVVFPVSELIDSFPTTPEAIGRYAPASGPFAGEEYPSIYSGMTTGFDDTLVLEEGGVLREKILLEYKTAKSSTGRQIDGNAHERLSFQIMQYLEVATRYTRCSLVVLANGAFIRYRNKYHVNFHVQADRLANFSWFTMEHNCTAAEYVRFVNGVMAWLFEGRDRNARSTP